MVVPRPRLGALLDRAAARAVTIVRAPAGSGKTAALAGWAGAGRDFAWVSLDRDDNDETRFWAAILGALRRCPAVPPDAPLRRLAPPAQGERREFLADLVDACAELPHPVRLVLDDFHEIVRPGPLGTLAAFARHQPSPLRLVLATRLEPPLRLARLQVQGGLSRIGAGELRFTREEAARLVRATGAEVSDERIRDLAERTAGWAAALGWAAVSVRGAEDADGLLRAVDGDDVAVARFFADEVLSQFSAATSELLLCISICDAVTPTLAARLSGRADAGVALDGLERSASLVVRSSADTYRLPPLLREFLRAELRRRHPARVAVLHGLAAHQYAEEGRIGEALTHAVAGQDPELVLTLVRGHGVRQVLAGEGEPVRDALGYLGAGTLDPGLRMASALEHVQRGDLPAAAEDLAGELPEDALHRLVAGHHALVSGRRPSWPAVAAPTRSPMLDAWEKLDLAWRSLYRGARGHAAAQAQEALRLAHHDGLDHLVLHSRLALAVAAGFGGDHRTMRRACTGALAVARRHGWRRSPGVSDCHLMLAYDDLMRYEPVAAAQELAQATAAEVPGAAPVLGPLRRFFDGVARFDGGDRAGGTHTMRQARHRLAELDLPRELAAVCAVIEHHAALTLGEGLHAAEVLAWAQDRLGGKAEPALMQARAHLAADEPDLADAALRDAQSASALLPGTPVYVSLVETALALRSNRRTKALQALDRALTLARPHGLMRPFALAEPRVGHLLIDHAGGFGALNRFAQSVRDRLAARSAGAPRGDLTDREQVVLRRLPSQRSLDEIASDLTVSVNTVKTHVRAIYGKLGVNNRRSAVVVARQHGLT